ncbi:MAG TPA: hypothetical protein VFW07_27535 [Parafilimonas sp.]|nr:hypothetical protein [Parafilimonas sp.]
MKRPERIPMFSKALLAGALTGIAATIINMIYDVVFRSITDYEFAAWFNFYTISFASILVLMITGMFFYLFARNNSFKSYDVAIVIIVIAVVAITALLHSDKSQSAFYGNHGLVAGFAVLSGILALTLLPYLFRHPKLFL